MLRRDAPIDAKVAGKVVDPIICMDFSATNVGKNETAKAVQCIVTGPCLFVFDYPKTKLRHMYPWAKLYSVQINPGFRTMCFSFAGGIIDIIPGNFDRFAANVITHIKSILPSWHPVAYDVPEKFNIPAGRPSPDRFLYLCKSEAHALGKTIDPSVAAALGEIVDNEVVIDTGAMSDSIVQAIGLALHHSPEITGLNICGKRMDDNWGRLGSIIDGNKTLTRLSVTGSRKGKGFADFIKGLRQSSVRSLAFLDVVFENDMARVLVSQLSKTGVTGIKFTSGIKQKNVFFDVICPLLSSTNDALSLLKSLAVDGDDVDQREVDMLVKLLNSASLESLSLTNAQMNLSMFFRSMRTSQNFAKLMSIDVSGNICPADYSGAWCIPTALKSLKVKHTTWEGRSMATLLAKQEYPSPIDLDVSHAIIRENQIEDLIQTIPTNPVQGLHGFHWNGNPLFTSLIRYFAKLKGLREISFADCVFPSGQLRDSVIVAINELLENNITHLAISGTMKNWREVWLERISGRLVTHPTLVSLDIRGNNIHDRGLAILEAILKANTKLRSLEFDDQCLSSTASLMVFIKFTGSLVSLEHIGKPTKEMQRFGELTGVDAVSGLTAIWNLAEERRKSPDKYISGSYSASTEETLAASVRLLPAPGAERYAELTWNVEIDLDNEGVGWSELEKKFSYSEILHVRSGRQRKSSMVGSPTPRRSTRRTSDTKRPVY